MERTFSNQDIADKLYNMGCMESLDIIEAVNDGIANVSEWEAYKEAIDKLMRQYDD